MISRKTFILLFLSTLLLQGCSPNSFFINLFSDGSKLELVSIDHDSDSSLTQDSVVTANLKYEIPHFESNKYFVIAQFSTTNSSSTTDGNFPANRYPIIVTPSGSIQINFPLMYVLNSPNIKRPLTMYFFLNEKVGQNSGHVVAMVGPIELK
ncbi:hypothetical protein S2091_2456 [Solimicrobium silvestre]|uniref:Lipoprotein n=1 Tax=Solimicrobium silvestre TaxID=2099400 RepID=A0A2S9GYJ3_9BURK|nr:hypothetical protein S2091_2456 [Solimicrobium silvestre]